MTNTIPSGSVAEWLSFQWLSELSAAGLLFLALALIGYVLRRLERIDNKWLAVLVPVAAVVYPLIGPSIILHTSTIAVVKDALTKGIVGVVLGCFAVLAVAVGHDKILAAVAARWPLFSILVSRDTAAPPQEQQRKNNEENTRNNNPRVDGGDPAAGGPDGPGRDR